MWPAQKERISGVTRWTTAHWNVINNVATCVTTACAWARIHAVLIDARFDARTIRIHCAFWSTIRIRISEIVGQTGAHTFVARRIRSTR